MVNTKKIFEYTDYREFLKDLFQHKKQAEGFTLREFARRSGLNTHSYLTNVIQNRRRLTIESAGKFAKGFGLDVEETEYFELMVRYANARTTDEKAKCYDQLSRKTPKRVLPAIEAKYLSIFEKPYILTVRELVNLPDFQEDHYWISRKLNPSITTGQAELALQTLLELGFLRRNKDGKLMQATPDITTGKEVKSNAVAEYHRQLLRLATGAISGTSSRERDISSLTVNLSQKEFEFIKKRIGNFRSELLDFLKKKRDNELPSDPIEYRRTIYYLNMQLFNATEISWSDL